MAQNDAITALSAQQLQAIAALSQGKSQEEAAKACGVTRRTIQRWLADCPEFRNALQWMNRELYDQIITQLLCASTKAVKTLVEVASDKKQTGAARVAASRAILELGMRGTLADEINHAIAVLRKYEFGVVDLRVKKEDG